MIQIRCLNYVTCCIQTSLLVMQLEVKVFVYWTVAWKVYNIKFILVKLSFLDWLHVVLSSLFAVQVWIRRSKKSRNLWSFPSHIQNIMRKWALNPPKELFCMDHQVLGKLCWPRQWLTKPQPHSWELLDLSSYRNIWWVCVCSCCTWHFKCYFGIGYG